MIMRNTEEEKKIVIASTKTETEKMINKNKTKQTNQQASKPKRWSIVKIKKWWMKKLGYFVWLRNIFLFYSFLQLGQIS